MLPEKKLYFGVVGIAVAISTQRDHRQATPIGIKSSSLWAHGKPITSTVYAWVGRDIFMNYNNQHTTDATGQWMAAAGL